MSPSHRISVHHHTASRYYLPPASSNHSMHFADQNNYNRQTLARTSSDFCATRRNSTEMDAISHLHHTAAGYNFTPHLGTICLLRRQITRCTLQTRTTTTIKQLHGHRVISAQRAEIVPRWMLHEITRCTLQSRPKVLYI